MPVIVLESAVIVPVGSVLVVIILRSCFHFTSFAFINASCAIIINLNQVFKDALKEVASIALIFSSTLDPDRLTDALLRLEGTCESNSGKIQ